MVVFLERFNLGDIYTNILKHFFKQVKTGKKRYNGKSKG